MREMEVGRDGEWKCDSESVREKAKESHTDLGAH